MPEWYEKQIGPLPLGIWVGVVAVGVGASIYINRKSSGAKPAASAPAADNAALQPATDGAFGSLASGVNLGGIVALPGGVPAGQVTYTQPPPENTILDNNDWLREATNRLIAKGYDPALVDKALRNYTQGLPVSTAEQAVVSLALQLLGAPPQPVIAVPEPTPTPTPTPTPAPTQKFGPVYPQNAPGQMPSDTTCPPDHPHLVQTAGYYTCMTKAQFNALQQYFGLPTVP